MSPPEAKLWNVLRNRPDGFKFRRQRPRDPFIFDFYCREALLAIEIDGFAHSCGDIPKRDEALDRWAAAKSIATLRIDASEVRDNLECVLTYILEHCRKKTPPPHCVRSPSPATAGEDQGAVCP
jgi:very-short-patch-repair endonuclease